MSDQLTAARIAGALQRRGLAAFGQPLTVTPRTGSTNDDGRLAALDGAAHGTVFLAEEQTAGRGRRGRTWHSPPGASIYLSVVLRPQVSDAVVPAITLAIGVAVARVVDFAGQGNGPTGMIKWPNDVLVGERKIAGVLVESFGRGAGGSVDAAVLVAGVGLNVRGQSFPAELAERATSLELLGCSELDRAELTAELLLQLKAVTDGFQAADGLSPELLAELTRRDALQGRVVKSTERHGVAVGVAANGCLRIRDDSGEVREIWCGEVVPL